jgi:hypothetical protein
MSEQDIVQRIFIPVEHQFDDQLPEITYAPSVANSCVKRESPFRVNVAGCEDCQHVVHEDVEGTNGDNDYDDRNIAFVTQTRSLVDFQDDASESEGRLLAIRQSSLTPLIELSDLDALYQDRNTNDVAEHSVPRASKLAPGAWLVLLMFCAQEVKE